MAVRLSIFLILLGFSARANECEKLFIGNVHDLGFHFSRGLQVDQAQEDLFTLYRYLYFTHPKQGDANPKTEGLFFKLLAENPGLEKRSFPEALITLGPVDPGPAEPLKKAIQSKLKTAGKLLSNFLQVESNQGYWRIALGGPPTALIESMKESISRKDPVFHRLLLLYRFVEAQTPPSPKRNQLLADLVSSVGFTQETTLALLKSPNSGDALRGLERIKEERDRFLKDLGFSNYEDFLKSLSVKASALDSDLTIKPLITPAVSSATSGVQYRVRALSLLESSYRSCLSGDCATADEAAFAAALNPYHVYFTLTDLTTNHSHGFAKVLLGTVEEQKGGTRKLARLDKLQGLSSDEIDPLLSGIQEILKESGYVIGIPDTHGALYALSNSRASNDYVQSVLLPRLTKIVRRFKLESPTLFPEAMTNYDEEYESENFPLYLYEQPTSLGSSPIVQPMIAKVHLQNAPTSATLIQKLLDLKHSRNVQDILYFMGIAKQIQKWGRFGYTHAQYHADLHAIVQNKRLDFKIRKQAMISLLMESQFDDICRPQGLLEPLPSLKIEDYGFQLRELQQIAAEIRQFQKSKDVEKQKFIENLSQALPWLASQGDFEMTRFLFDLQIFKPNFKSPDGGYSLPFIAAQNHQLAYFKSWLGLYPFDFESTDPLGFTLFDHLKYLGHREFLDALQAQGIHAPAPYSPPPFPYSKISFIPIARGTYKHEVEAFFVADKRLTTAIYLRLAGDDDALKLGKPSHPNDHYHQVTQTLEGEEQRYSPQMTVMLPYEKATRFIQRLNELSAQKSPLLQEVFEDHQPGDRYDLISDDQYAYLSSIARTQQGLTVDQVYEQKNAKLFYEAVVESGENLYPWNVLNGAVLRVSGKPIHQLFSLSDQVWTQTSAPSTTATQPQQVTRGGIIPRYEFYSSWGETIPGQHHSYREWKNLNGLRIVRIPRPD